MPMGLEGMRNQAPPPTHLHAHTQGEMLKKPWLTDLDVHSKPGPLWASPVLHENNRD